ncbi:DUF4260 family protein [Enterovibrio sp. 27052020O]|uniref:DUF4260 family protein n=1 Tax=Enterovibrio sp. 27052020O TaxID=3241166 RepID=UPI00388D8C7E
MREHDVHQYGSSPLTVQLALSLFFPPPAVTCASLIGFAHIGLDRALGDDLKDSNAFVSTHLARIGQRAKHSES